MSDLLTQNNPKLEEAYRLFDGIRWGTIAMPPFMDVFNLYTFLVHGMGKEALRKDFFATDEKRLFEGLLVTSFNRMDCFDKALAIRRIFETKNYEHRIVIGLMISSLVSDQPDDEGDERFIDSMWIVFKKPRSVVQRKEVNELLREWEKCSFPSHG